MPVEESASKFPIKCVKLSSKCFKLNLNEIFLRATNNIKFRSVFLLWLKEGAGKIANGTCWAHTCADV